MNYGVILADPPWSYDRGRVQGVAEREYAVLSEGVLQNMPVSSFAAKDSVLLLWATWPQLEPAMRLIAAWGFSYLTGFPWVKLQGEPFVNLWGKVELKPQYGVGYWVRGCTEPLLVCRRGNVSPPSNGFCGLLSQNFGHSRKPDNVYQFAEALPGPYLELFARRRRDGWDAWGNEIESSVEMGPLRYD